MPLTGKLLATAMVTVLIVSPWWWSGSDGGILRELALLGAWGSVAVGAAFFALVACYCRLLQRTLERIAPAHRTASPRSVWWMFAIPYNFVEDFVIVGNVASSLRAAAAARPGALRRWLLLGWAWCALQILSLLPGELGMTTGALALLAWLAHWVFTARLHARLPAVSPSPVE